MTRVPGLEREQRGRTNFQRLLLAWIHRSKWSYKVMRDLCELAILDREAPGVQAIAAGRYERGDLVLSDGQIWEARRAVTVVAGPNGQVIGPKRAETRKGAEVDNKDWKHLLAIRRVQTSQINLIAREPFHTVNTALLDAFGILNEWLAEIRAGRAAAPLEPRLRERVMNALVVEDADGVYGPEEWFAVMLGRLEPPNGLASMTPAEAAEASQQLARQIRQGMMAAGLDLLDDWPQFVAQYPSSDRERLGLVRDVAMGRGSWSPEQVEDEQAAVTIALARLKALSRKPQN